MLNKKLVLGSLAGATLLVGAAFMLPSVAQAGVVSGTCVNCHTMHDSNNGATMATAGPNDFLLIQDGCTGCHTGGTNAAATGKMSTTPWAPQVDDAALPLAGGYFGTTPGNAHNVTAADAALDFASGVSPTPSGGVVSPFVASAAVTATFDCIDCHGAVGGDHHGATDATSARTGSSTAGDSYRFLDADSDNATPADGVYVASNASSGTWEAVVAETNSYVAADMNTFCAACHPGFHSTTNTGGTGATGTGPFVRHPTNVSTTGYGALYLNTVKAIPVGTGGAGNEVMCVSCHRAHGTGQPDLLRFTYSTNVAGDGTATLGCETCHGSK